MTAVLAGIQVVDLSRVLAGPFAGQVLAEMGADVIKVELPAGDPARAIGPHAGERSLYFSALNTGKRGVVVDPSSPADMAFLERLYAIADVVLENFLPDTAASLGLRPDDFRHRHPHVVLVTVSGYARNSDRARTGGFDLTIQAETGIMSLTGEPGGSPVRAGVPVGDLAAGLWAALGAVGALVARASTGQGAHVEAPLLDSTLPLLSYMAAHAWQTGHDPPKVGSGHHFVVPYGAFPALDGWIAIAALGDKFWAPLCDALDLPQLAADDELATGSGRHLHRARVEAAVAAATSTRLVDDLLARLADVGIPASPVLGVLEALRTEYVRRRGLVEIVETDEGPYPHIRGPFEDRARRSRPAPRLGQHDEEVRAEITRRTSHRSARRSHVAVDRRALPRD
jgi:formyl-CoA transferase/CoA:oxalate CoA-transferase